MTTTQTLPPTDPVLQWHVAQSMGVDQLAQSITGWEQVYDQTSRGRFHGALTELLLGPAQLFVESSSHSLVQNCRTWPEAVWFGIPVQSDRLGRIEGTPIEPGMLALRTGRSDFQLTTPDDFGFLGVVVQAEVLQRYVERESGELSSSMLDQRVLRVPAEDLESLRRWLCHMLQASSSLPEAPTPAAREHVLDEILSGLVHLLMHRQEGPRDAVSSQHARRMLRRAREYLLAHTDRCVTVHELCTQLGTSRRALQDCFRKSMGLSPKAYLRAFGLNAARRDLRQENSGYTTVSDVATRHGFWHLSQFAADYRWLFDELPSETLRQRHGRTAPLQHR